MVIWRKKRKEKEFGWGILTRCTTFLQITIKLIINKDFKIMKVQIYNFFTFIIFQTETNISKMNSKKNYQESEEE